MTNCGGSGFCDLNESPDIIRVVPIDRAVVIAERARQILRTHLMNLGCALP